MNPVFVAVRDSAMQAFANPQMVPAPQVAVRGFTSEVNRADPANTLYTNPGDFELHLLAEFDPVAGKFIEPEGGVRLLVRAVDVRQAADPV